MRGIKRVEFPTGIKNPKRAGLAWAVHLFTASGIVLGFLAVVAVLNSNITVAFLWLGVALFVDGVDGWRVVLGFCDIGLPRTSVSSVYLY